MKKTSFFRFGASLMLIYQLLSGTVAAQTASPSATSTGGEPRLTAGNVDASSFPLTSVNFTIEKEGTVFRQLETSDVEVLLDGQKVSLKSDALNKTRDSEAVKVLFVIDKSGSMIVGADKLQAAKDALRNFVEKLSPQDEVSISTFGVDYAEVLRLTKVENKSEVFSKLDSLKATDPSTNFYDSVQKAVEQADRSGVKNIIFLSDGKEDSSSFNRLTTESEKTSEKRRREKDLADRFNQKGIRFFAVAIGNPEAAATDEAFVDYDSMRKIAEPTQGKADLVNLPQVESEAKGDKEKSKNLIADRLKDQLAEIKKALKFSYALNLDLPKITKEKGEMVLNFKISDGKNLWRQSTTYPYTTQNGKPFFEKARVLPFILSSAAKSLSFINISLIYLLMLVPLTLLSLIPGIFNKFAAIAEEKKVSEAIVQVHRTSQMIGKNCPSEGTSWGNRFAFREGDTIIICPQCGTPHHLACWAENRFQCMHRLCESRYQIPAPVLAKYNVKV